MLSHNNCSKDNDFDLENLDSTAADDDDVADDDADDDAADDDVDVDALVFTISLVLISSHCCLAGCFAICSTIKSVPA